MVETNQTSKPVDTLLFTPIRFGSVKAKNRIVISPMCQYTSKDGFANDWHLVHLGARAIGGAGIVMMEAAGVEPRGRITPGCVGVWKDEHIEPLKRITSFLEEQNCVPAIQLAHAGRKASTFPPFHPSGRGALPDEEGGWDVIGPSAIAFGRGNERVPKEATLEDIETIKTAFVDATKRSVAAGFRVIELHFAHGYLVDSFLSPVSNKRTDKYGGSFENRTRLAIELVQEIKKVLPVDFPLFVRISCLDYLPTGEGWDLQQSIELGKKFKQLGVDLIDCSSGGNIADVKLSFVYNNVDQITTAEIMQKEVDLPTGAVGGIVNARWSEAILQANKATLIFIGRVSLEDPNWPQRAAFELNAQHQQSPPPQYIWAIGERTSGNWRQNALAQQNRADLEKLSDLE